MHILNYAYFCTFVSLDIFTVLVKRKNKMKTKRFKSQKWGGGGGSGTLVPPLNNNIDHMRISGNEPSSVILGKTKWFQKLKMIAKKCQNKLKPKGMV